MALATGAIAPHFTLKTKTADGLKEVSLGDSIGKKPVVLLFFPLAFTSGCEKEMCTVRDSLKDFESLEATVYGISVDSPFAQEAFAKANQLNFSLLSDFNREAAKAYDVVLPELAGLKNVAMRSAFVIDRSGTIVFSTANPDPKVQPDFDAIKAALKSA
ncbi:MAG: peroxiredoxin [Puniceicoccaceae bacterium]|nr:MAG: peroxiredoxin [Puniceicoccaceae bacterium]